jgi:hypothetical protein
MNHVNPINGPIGEQRSESRSEPMKAITNKEQPCTSNPERSG